MTVSTAIYSMPGSSDFFRVSGRADIIHPAEVFRESGFVFAPFDSSSDPIYRINGQPASIGPKELAGQNWIKNSRDVVGTKHEEYRSMFDQAMESIHSGNPEKIVISVREPEYEQIKSIPEFLQQLRLAYPTAFIYLFYIPGTELWIGASPELLLHTDHSDQRTVALAGTLKDAPRLDQWSDKERIEHHYVEQFIEEVIASHTFHKVGPRPVKAGPVFHLKSEYEIRDSVVNPFDLHPGPALSGYPVTSAVERIQQIESSPRRYYTGFLGPVWNQDNSHLFINLRCLEVLSEYSILYAGGGLTVDSKAEDEWLEIRDKLSTLRSKIYKGQQQL